MNQKTLLVVGGVGLKRGRIVNSQKAMISLATEINAYLRESKFLAEAPFSVISLIFRYGEEFGIPEIQPIDKKNGELPVAVESLWTSCEPRRLKKLSEHLLRL